MTTTEPEAKRQRVHDPSHSNLLELIQQLAFTSESEIEEQLTIVKKLLENQNTLKELISDRVNIFRLLYFFFSSFDIKWKFDLVASVQTLCDSSCSLRFCCYSSIYS
jgi:glutaredoxin 2